MTRTSRPPSNLSKPAPTSAYEQEHEHPAPHPSPSRAVALLVALVAGACWTGALTLLLLIDLRAVAPLSPQRLLFCVLVLVAGLLTFVPVEQRMELPGITVEGTGGTVLLLYTLAFVPPPTGWLLSLPDLPVYGLFALAVFWSAAATALPFVHAIRQRVIKQRPRRLNVQESHRQSHEVGFLVASLVVLAGLRVLTVVSFLLLALIVVTSELLMLARSKPR